MMDPNEITKVIDGVYKNILENFNPSSRQMIATGKAYLKSLHGASAACSMYLDTLVKLSRQAQQSSLGCSNDIGSSLIQVTDVFKEIHTQQMNTLKAFYVDFLVPLETNLEKDTRVIQNEQKKFLMCHKQRIESYNKAAASVKKMRKKTKKCNSSTTLDKEIKVMQHLEEEKSKMEAFCEKSLNEALTQERRRYGFILERQASLAKHYLAFFSKGNGVLSPKLDVWMKVAKSREMLPESMQNTLLKRIQLGGEEDCIYCQPRRPADDTVSISSQLRKTKSMDANEILGSGGSGHQGTDLPITSAGSLSRAKSDLNLMLNGGCSENCQGSTPSTESPTDVPMHHHTQQQQNTKNFRPKSLAVSTETTNCGYAKALYAYLSSGENQLCFLEGDTIALIGDRTKGWQFGENLRTQKTGWFPVAYTESDGFPMNSSSGGEGSSAPSAKSSPAPPPMPPPPAGLMTTNPHHHNHNHLPTTPGGFSQKRLNLENTFVHRTPEGGLLMSKPGLKSPGTPSGSNNMSASTQTNLMIPSSSSCRASDSLHSSNDSGFSLSNDMGHRHQHQQQQGVQQPPIIPPQPEVDYSDDEPQLSNSEEPKSGDKWLMDRYHKSESARIGQANIINGHSQSQRGPRRSLSFINVSEMADEEDERDVHVFNPNSVRRPYPPRAGPRYNQQKNAQGSGNNGAFKKLLNRTKSLIFKKPGDTNGEQFESISTAGSFSDLWGSHASLVELSQAQYINGNGHSPGANSADSKKQIHEPNRSVDKAVQANERRRFAAPSDPPPLPPPLPSRGPSKNSPELPSPPLQHESDNTKQNGHVVLNNPNQTDMMPSKRTVNKVAAQEMIEVNGSLNRSNKTRKAQGQRMIRVESFSGSEAPIVPTSRSRVGSNRVRHKAATPFARSVASAKASQLKPRYESSKASVTSDNFEDDEEEELTLEYDDNNSSIFIEDEMIAEESETPVPPVPKPKGSFRRNGTSQGSARMKSQSLRISNRPIPAHAGRYRAANNRNISPAPTNSIMDGDEGENENMSVQKAYVKRPTRFKGSIRSEYHTVELIATDSDGGQVHQKPLFDYGNQIHRRLYYPERSSRIDQKSERGGNLCGPCYGERNFMENEYPTLKLRRSRPDSNSYE